MMQEINLQNAFRSIPSDEGVLTMSDDEYQEWLCEKENARKVQRKDRWDDVFEDDCPLCGNKGQVW